MTTSGEVMQLTPVRHRSASHARPSQTVQDSSPSAGTGGVPSSKCCGCP